MSTHLPPPGSVVDAFCDRYGWLALALMLVWGLVVRLSQWGEFWIGPDEGLYFDAATTSLARARVIIELQANPPLYYHLLRGVAAAGGGVDAMRGVSLAMGATLPLLLFGIGRQWAGSAAGLVAALLMVNGPGPVDQSQIMRPYVPQCFFLAFGTWFFFRMLGRGRAVDAFGFAASWSAALLLHYSTYLAIGGAGLYAGWIVLTRRPDRRFVLVLALAFAALGSVGVHLYATHVGPTLQGSALQAYVRETYLRAHFAGGLAEALQSYLRLPVYLFGRPTQLALPWLVPLAAAVAPAGARSRPALLALAILAIAAAFSLAGQYPFGPTRHSLYLGVFMAPAAGAAIAGLLRSGRLPLIALGSASLIVALLPLGRDAASRELRTPRSEAEAMAGRIEAETAPGDIVLMDYPSYATLLPLLPETPIHDRIRGVRGYTGFESAGRAYSVSWRWWNEPESGHRNLAAWLSTSSRSREYRWDTDAHGVWLLLAGASTRVASELPEQLDDGRPLRGAILGGPRLALVSIHPRALVDHVHAAPDP